MMLRALVDLAARRNLVAGEDLEPKHVDFEIALAADGRFLAFVSLRDEVGKGRRMAVPRLPIRASNVAAGTLVDNAKYVLGIGDPKKDKPARLRQCRDAFVARIREATSKSTDPALQALSSFYDRPSSGLERARSEVHDWTGSELLIFSVQGLGYIHERPDTADLLRALRAEADSEDEDQQAVAARCLVTGHACMPARLHPKLKRVPGGQSSGHSLVSFNADAFTSHSLAQGNNAPVSRDAAIAYTSALQWLLERDTAANRPFRYGVGLGPTAVAVYWTAKADAEMDFFADLWNGPRPEQAEAFYTAPWKGEPPSSLDPEPFFALTLGGNAGRVAVRDWFEATLGEVKKNVQTYFEDLALEGASRPLAIWQLLAAIDPPGNAGPPADLAGRLFAASLRGTPLPRELLRHALSRLRLPPHREKNATALLHARVALIKATLRGIGRTDIARPYLKEVTVSLDDGSTQVPYVLGRLFAALERAQQNALGGDLGATIRDRYFGAASTAPATVFPRLLRLAQHHVSKAKADGRDYGIEKTLGHIAARLPASGFPGLLSLEDQGLFAVGYYHQREAFFAGRKAAEVN